MDPVASLYGRNYAQDLVQELSAEIFVPMAVGGGLRTVSDVREVLESGADKVMLNTAAVLRPGIISEIVEAFGSSTVGISINAISRTNLQYEVLIEGGRQTTGINVHDWTKRVQDLGAGEIVITSVDREGTGHGFDLALIESILDICSVPLLVGGGCGSVDHVVAAAKLGVDGIILASILHYSSITGRRADSAGDRDEGNFEFLRSGRQLKNFDNATIGQIKTKLRESGFECRPLETRPS